MKFLGREIDRLLIEEFIDHFGAFVIMRLHIKQLIRLATAFNLFLNLEILKF